MSVAIDNARINTLVNRPDIVKEFPFLAMTAVNDKRCCGEPPRIVNYNAIKIALAGMPTERKELFKQMIGSPQCHVHFQENQRIHKVDL